MMDGAFPKPLEVPHNIDAEQALLGSIFVWNETLDRIGELEPKHFFDPLLGRVFEVARATYEAGRKVTPVTLKSFFDDAKPIGGEMPVYQFLGTLAARAVSIPHAKDYANEIRDLYTRRQLIVLGQELSSSAWQSGDASVTELIGQTEAALYGLAEKTTYGSGSAPLSSVLSRVVEQANEAYRTNGKACGISTGFRDLDAKIGGLRPGNLVIIAGRPGMGKSVLAANIGMRMAKRDIPVQFDSLEMSADELGERILADEAEIPLAAMRNGNLKEADIRTLLERSQEINGFPFYLDATGGMTIGRLSARARRVKRQRNIGCLIVDYLQLMAGGSQNRVSDVTDITMGLKALAKELDIPVIALSQLSRAVEQRQDKRPQLSDLRESGSIEQDADIVMFVYREAYYVEREEPTTGSKAEWQERLASIKGKAEVIVGKHRHGSTGIVQMAFDGKHTRFDNLAVEPHPAVGRYA
jgi:replicative DNA helicase